MFNLLPLAAIELTSGITAAISLGLVVVYFVVSALLKRRKVDVTFVDSENNQIIGQKKYRCNSKIDLGTAVKPGDVFIGWSYTADGSSPCKEKFVTVKRKTTFYAIWDKPAVKDVIAIEDANMYIEFAYMDENGAELRRDTMPLVAFVPDNFNRVSTFKGWVDGDTFLEKNFEGSTLAVSLYPVFTKAVGNIDKDEGEIFASDTYSIDDANMYVEFTFNDRDGEKLSSNIMPVMANVPVIFNGVDGFKGWATAPAGNVVIDKDVEGSVLSYVFAPKFVSPSSKKDESANGDASSDEESHIEDTAEEIPVEETPVEETPVEETPVEETPVEEAPVEETPVEETPVEETPVEEAPAEEAPAEEAPAEEAPAEPVAPTIVPTYFDIEGNHIDIKYSRSFISNIIQGDEVVKEYYSELKNHILSYEEVKSRLSWKFDSYNRGRDQLFKIKVRGKTICIYLALDPNNYDVSKYHHEAIDAKIFEDVPMLFKIKSGLGLRKAKQLVDDTMARFDIKKCENPEFVDYVKEYPYVETEELVQKKLVKVLVSDGNVTVKSGKKSDDEEEMEAPVVDETPIEETPVAEENAKVLESVSADDADALLTDEAMDAAVESGVEYVTKNDTKKASVNVGILNSSYNAGEVVDLTSLKKKKLIDSKAKSVKILASGTINKPLTVKAAEFSKTAIKMILLTGGKVIKVTTQVK